MKLSKFLFNLCVIALMAVMISSLFDVPVLATFGVLLVVGLATYQTKRLTGASFFEGLAPEVWLPMVMEDPIPTASFLNGATDMTSLVENDAINLAEAGADPDVLVDNTVFPIPEAVAEDTPLRVVLRTYDTTSTIVRNAVAIELAYDQRLLYANKHKRKLAAKLGQHAAFNYAPASHDPAKFNNIINLGANDSMIDGIIDLQAAYNLVDQDGTGRNLVLSALHQAKIAKEDKLLYKAFMAEPGMMYCGFRLWSYSQNPLYIANDQTKAAFGVAYNPAIHKYASFSFIKEEVMVAQGSAEMFSRLKDPDIKGDKFNFQRRALAVPLRNKFQGAILQ